MGASHTRGLLPHQFNESAVAILVLLAEKVNVLMRIARPTSALASLVVALSLLVCACSDMDRAKSDESAARRYSVRGIYGRDSSATGFDHLARLGFNFIDSGPYKDRMQRLTKRGLEGFVWLGGYSNTTCSFVKSDRWVRTRVAEIAHTHGVGAYFIDDEPDASKCANSPAQIRARSRLVKSIDSRVPTFLVTYHVDQLKLFARTVDVIGLDHYPCSRKHGCDYSVIDEQAAEADRLGIRYWGVIQAYGDDWYALPSPDDLHRQFERWRQTEMEGYLVFGWRWPLDQPDLWLERQRQLHSQLAGENKRASTGGS